MKALICDAELSCGTIRLPHSGNDHICLFNCYRLKKLHESVETDRTPINYLIVPYLIGWPAASRKPKQDGVGAQTPEGPPFRCRCHLLLLRLAAGQADQPNKNGERDGDSRRIHRLSVSVDLIDV